MRNVKWNLRGTFPLEQAWPWSPRPLKFTSLWSGLSLPRVGSVEGDRQNPTASATVLRDTCYFGQLQNKHHSGPLQAVS